MTRPGWLTVAEIAAELRVDPETVRRMIRRGDLAAFRYGSCLRVKRTDLDAFISARMGRASRRLRSA